MSQPKGTPVLQDREDVRTLDKMTSASIREFAAELRELAPLNQARYCDSHLDKAADALDALADERDEHEQAFDLQWSASRRAIERWQEAHPGNGLVWPDHADLCVWLMGQLAGLED